MKPTRAAMYLRVSTDGQTTENQRLALAAVADRRGWQLARVFEDQGVSGAQGRDQRPGFDAMLKDARRRRFDVLMFWSVDRLGRSTATVTAALEELDRAGVAIYADKEAMDTSTAHGRAMLQMAAVFAELERGMIRERVKAGLARARANGKRLGRKPLGRGRVAEVRARLLAGMGIGRICEELHVGSSAVQRIRREMGTQTPKK